LAGSEGVGMHERDWALEYQNVNWDNCKRCVPRW